MTPGLLNVLITLFVGVAIWRVRVTRRVFHPPQTPINLARESMDVTGLRELPWELEVVQSQLEGDHTKIIPLLNQLVIASNLPPNYQLGPTASRTQIEQLVVALEHDTGITN